MGMSKLKSTLPLYFTSRREILAEEVREKGNTVLDVGCASGAFGAGLKAIGKANVVYGIEINADVAEHAQDNIDHVMVADLNLLTADMLYEQWGRVEYDYVVFGDVLEHLVDPERLMRSLASFLGPHGKFIISVPNVRNFSVLVDLVFNGDWRYSESGILDKTHLRFYTRRSFNRLIDDLGFDIEASRLSVIGKKTKSLNALTLGFFQEFFAKQIIFVVNPRN